MDSLPRNLEGAMGSAGRPIDEAVARALSAFRIDDPSASVPSLAQGLKLTREATDVDDRSASTAICCESRSSSSRMRSMRRWGRELTAITNPALMGAPVPGQTFSVDARLEIRGGVIEKPQVTLLGSPGFRVTGRAVFSSDGGCRCAAQHEAVFLSQRVAGKPLHAARCVAVWAAGDAGAADGERDLRCRRCTDRDSRNR